MSDVSTTASKRKHGGKSDGANDRKRKRNWTQQESSILIAVWGEKAHQEGFEGLQYNSRVWQSIHKRFRELCSDCPYQTWECLKDRIDYLKRKYREVKKVNNASGRGRITCPHYDELDEILGRRPMTNCRAFHHADADLSSDEDSSQDSAPPSVQSDLVNYARETITDDMNAMDEESGHTSNDTSSQSLNTSAELEPESAVDQTKKKAKQEKYNGLMTRKRRGKRSQIEEAMATSISTLIESQQATRDDSMLELLQLEKDRFQWERERDRREDQWRRDKLAAQQAAQQTATQQNHQLLLQLASMFANNSNTKSYANLAPCNPTPNKDMPGPVHPYIDHNTFNFNPQPPHF